MTVPLLGEPTFNPSNSQLATYFPFQYSHCKHILQVPLGYPSRLIINPLLLNLEADLLLPYFASRDHHLVVVVTFSVEFDALGFHFDLLECHVNGGFFLLVFCGSLTAVEYILLSSS